MSSRFLCIAGGEPQQHIAMTRCAQARLGFGACLTLGPATFVFPAATIKARSAAFDALIIGAIYRGYEVERTGELSAAEWGELSQSHGCSLLTSHWGNWIACTWDAAKRTLQLLRDPSGAAPCYYGTEGNMTILASDVRDLERIGFLKPAINWDALANILVRPGHHAGSTAIAGVSELLPGCMMCLGPDDATSRSQPVWSPWNFVSDGTPGRDAATGLAQVLDGVTRQMARSSQRAVLSLSGGLDSSLVAAALAGAGQQTDCLTMMTGDAEGDESHFASTVAKHLGFSLVGHRYNLAKIDLRYSGARHLPRPTSRSFAQGADRFRNAYAAEHGADLIFAGDGGDNVFCFLQSVLPILDRWQAEGPGRGVTKTVRDMSLLSRCSVISVARRALRRKLRGGGYQWHPVTRFLSSQAVSRSAKGSAHPWLVVPPGAALGKAAHIAMLVRSQLYHEAREPGNASVRLPLLAQPLVEYCLRIPTWEWCEGGHNRVIARQAYADRLPASVLLRRTKGGADSLCVALVDANIGPIRELLLEGFLAREGLLETDAVAASLAGPVRSGADTHRLLALVDAEAWARSWVA